MVVPGLRRVGESARSVIMISYLTSNQNHLFPLYVLLLLLAIVHGRPYALTSTDLAPQMSLSSSSTSLIQTLIPLNTKSQSPSSSNFKGRESKGESEKLSSEQNLHLLLPPHSDTNTQDEDIQVVKDKILEELGLSNSPKISSSESKDTNTISKINQEELISVYLEYMRRVRERRESQREERLFGAKLRQKKSITAHETFSGVQTEILKNGLHTFAFNVDLDPESEHLRIKKAILKLPLGCSLAKNGTFLKERMDNSLDLTPTLTSWIFREKKRDLNGSEENFKVEANCESENKSRGKRSIDAELKVLSQKWAGSQSEFLEERRVKRRALRHKKEQETFSNFENEKGKKWPSMDCTKTRHGKNCCRRSLKIKFSDLGINEIIQPKEFDAYICAGRCTSRRLNYSTNHAYFQHIMHQKNGKKAAPRPCCTPSKLSPLDVLQLVHSENGTQSIRVDILQNAIVEECGCS